MIDPAATHRSTHEPTRARIERDIARWGVHISYVLAGSGLPFGYSVGLWGHGHPELVVVAVTPERTAWWINTVAERVLTGRPLRAGEVVRPEGTCADHRVVVEPVPNPARVLLLASGFYGCASVPAFQLTWAEQGRLPGELGWSSSARQPRPGEWDASLPGEGGCGPHCAGHARKRPAGRPSGRRAGGRPHTARRPRR